MAVVSEAALWRDRYDPHEALSPLWNREQPGRGKCWCGKKSFNAVGYDRISALSRGLRNECSCYPSYYQRDSPKAMHKIEELERHLAVMRDNSRQLSEKLICAEQAVQELERENKHSKHRDNVAKYSHARELREEQRRLEQEIADLRDELEELRDVSRKAIDDNRRLSKKIERRESGDGLSDWGRRQREKASKSGSCGYSSCGSRSSYDFEGCVDHRTVSRHSESAHRYESPHASPYRCLSPCITPRRWGSATSLESPSTGYRSVLHRPIPYQHNKSYLYPTALEAARRSCESLSSLAPRRRIFVPNFPSDLTINDVVEFCRPGSATVSKGSVKFIGHLPGKSEAFIGVELDHECERLFSAIQEKKDSGC